MLVVVGKVAGAKLADRAVCGLPLLITDQGFIYSG